MILLPRGPVERAVHIALWRDPAVALRLVERDDRRRCLGVRLAAAELARAAPTAGRGLERDDLDETRARALREPEQACATKSRSLHWLVHSVASHVNAGSMPFCEHP